MKFAKMMATPLGRLVRVGAGALLVYLGFWRVQGIGGIALGIVGLVPLFAGALNFCAIAALIGAPFWGRDARHERPHAA